MRLLDVNFSSEAPAGVPPRPPPNNVYPFRTKAHEANSPCEPHKPTSTVPPPPTNLPKFPKYGNLLHSYLTSSTRPIQSSRLFSNSFQSRSGLPSDITNLHHALAKARGK